MMTPSGIATWLEGQGVTPDMFVTDGEIPPAPDRLVIIQMTGGPGESRERTFDALSFQVRVRGKQYVEDDASALAWQVDDVLLGAHPPVTISGVRVISGSSRGRATDVHEKDDGGSEHYAAPTSPKRPGRCSDRPTSTHSVRRRWLRARMLRARTPCACASATPWTASTPA
jgi:hypothetical protein